MTLYKGDEEKEQKIDEKKVKQEEGRYWQEEGKRKRARSNVDPTIETGRTKE